MVIRTRGGLVDIHGTLAAQRAQLEDIREDFSRVRASQELQKRQLEGLGIKVKETERVETARRERREKRRKTDPEPGNKLNHLVILLFIIFMMRSGRR